MAGTILTPLPWKYLAAIWGCPDRGSWWQQSALVLKKKCFSTERRAITEVVKILILGPLTFTLILFLF